MDKQVFFRELINNRFDLYKTIDALSYELFDFFQILKEDSDFLEELQSYEKAVKITNRIILFSRAMCDKPDFNSQKLMEEKVFKELSIVDNNTNTAKVPVFDEDGEMRFEEIEI